MFTELCGVENLGTHVAKFVKSSTYISGGKIGFLYWKFELYLLHSPLCELYFLMRRIID